jgi:hypothetical protein
MSHKAITISLLLAFFFSLPLPALAFWGRNDSSNPPSLNLKSGYDVNTVATVTGRISSIYTGDDRPNVELKLESEGEGVVICIGPQRYWAENVLPFKTGDEITVRGSKAQGGDGIIYLMAQKITGTTQDVSVILRDDSGRPVWAGNGMRNKRPLPAKTQVP